ncbi:MAG TPA: hypothetical protein VGF50_10765 [Caulobacteraceae bacterium]
MSVRSRVCRLGCACAAIVVLVGCARQGGATTNRPAPAANVAGVTAALPDSPPANTSQNDLFPIDNAAANATNTVDPAQASLLAEKNADCVDQLIKAQPFGESRSQIIGNVTKACLPIARMATQGSTEPPASIEASERRFVAGRVHDLADDTNAAAPNSSSPGG